MKFKVTLQDTRNNFEKEHQGNYDWQDSDTNTAFDSFTYQWTDGNYGCDCNRLIFLYGNSEQERTCSTGLIKVIKIVDEDGEEYPIDEFNQNSL